MAAAAIRRRRRISRTIAVPPADRPRRDADGAAGRVRHDRHDGAGHRRRTGSVRRGARGRKASQVDTGRCSRACAGSTSARRSTRWCPAASITRCESDAAYRRFERALLDAYGPGQLAPVDGAVDALQRCRAAGVKTALNTGFERSPTEHVVGVLGWQAVADTVVCGDDVAAGRPAPFLIYRAMERTGVIDVATVAVVGDTTADLEAAHHARAGWNIGVWSGAHDRARSRARAAHASVRVGGRRAGDPRDPVSVG
ncbi:MAG: HAD hydrolase-like protein [Vicinamibacterales bacterium]